MDNHILTITILVVLLWLSIAIITYYYRLYKKYLPAGMRMREYEKLVADMIRFVDDYSGINRSFDDILEGLRCKSYKYDYVDVGVISTPDLLSSIDFSNIESTLTRLQFKVVYLHANGRTVYGWERNGFEIYLTKDLGRERAAW